MKQYKILFVDGDDIELLDKRTGTTSHIDREDLFDAVEKQDFPVEGIRFKNGKPYTYMSDIYRKEYNELKKQVHSNYCEFLAKFVLDDDMEGDKMAMTVMYENHVSLQEIAKQFSVSPKMIGAEVVSALRLAIERRTGRD